MKEKMAGKETKKRLFSGTLALTMILSMMQITSIPVIAASYSDGELFQGNGNWYWEKGRDFATVAEGDVLSNLTYWVYDESVTQYIYCDGVTKAKADLVSGTVVKIESQSKTIYICTAADHEANKDTTTGLCTTCAPDSGSGDSGSGSSVGSSEGGSGSDITWGHFNSRNTEFWYDTAYVNVDDDGYFVDVYCTEHSEGDLDHLMKIMFYHGMTSEWMTYDPCSHIVFEDPTAHTHNFAYSASGATLKATCGNTTDCNLTSEDKSVSLTLSASSPNYSGSASTITIGTDDERTAWEEAGLTVPAISYEKADGTALDTAPTTPGSYKAKVTAGEGSDAVTAEVSFTIYANSYTLTVPADLTITQPGWNALDSVNVSGNISPDKQIKVTAASANEFKLKSGENTVSYTLKKSEADTEELGTVTFSSAAVNAENGVSQTVGINVEDYSDKPEGNYEDTITWTATMENVSSQS